MNFSYQANTVISFTYLGGTSHKYRTALITEVTKDSILCIDFSSNSEFRNFKKENIINPKFLNANIYTKNNSINYFQNAIQLILVNNIVSDDLAIKLLEIIVKECNPKSTVYKTQNAVVEILPQKSEQPIFSIDTNFSIKINNIEIENNNKNISVKKIEEAPDFIQKKTIETVKITNQKELEKIISKYF